MSIRAGLLALALAASTLAAADARSAASTGRLSGLTQITYGCPGPVRDDEQCERWFPFARARFAVTGLGTRRVVTSDDRGRFALSLNAGRYTLTPLPQAHTHGGPRVSVVVRVGEVTSALVRFQGFPMMV